MGCFARSQECETGEGEIPDPGGASGLAPVRPGLSHIAPKPALGFVLLHGGKFLPHEILGSEIALLVMGLVDPLLLEVVLA
jgi:hypothetical protein